MWMRIWSVTMGGNQGDCTRSEYKGLEGAEIPSFIYSSRGGKDGFPKVRVFDESGGGNQINIPQKVGAP